MMYRLYKNEFLGWKRSKTKHLSNIVLLHELPFYDELSVVEISKAFKGYARSYKIEIIDSKDLLSQLEASKLSIKDLFNKSKITVKVLLSKHKGNEDK